MALWYESKGFLVVVLTNDFQQFTEAEGFLTVQFGLKISLLNKRNYTISSLIIPFSFVVTVFREFLQTSNKIVDSFTSRC